MCSLSRSKRYGRIVLVLLAVAHHQKGRRYFQDDGFIHQGRRAEVGSVLCCCDGAPAMLRARVKEVNQVVNFFKSRELYMILERRRCTYLDKEICTSDHCVDQAMIDLHN